MSRYTSKHTGPVIDAAIDRAKTGGAIDTTLQNKAPAGYGGFGETLPYIAAGNDDADGSKFDALIEAKFATLSNNTTLQLRFDCYPYISGSLFFGTLWKSSNNYGVLTGWSYDGSIIRKVKTGGAWLPFEWVNPPLTSGKEYRTTERYLGKPVYVKAINFGALPNATTKSVSHGASNVDVCIRATGSITSGDKCSIPFADINGRVDIFGDSGQVTIKTDYNYSSLSAHATIWYTKTTD